jgi:hypothetical protein
MFTDIRGQVGSIAHYVSYLQLALVRVSQTYLKIWKYRTDMYLSMRRIASLLVRSVVSLRIYCNWVLSSTNINWTSLHNRKFVKRGRKNKSIFIMTVITLILRQMFSIYKWKSRVFQKWKFRVVAEVWTFKKALDLSASP